MRQINITTDCLMVGDYIDEAEVQQNVAHQLSESQLTQYVADYIDTWNQDDGIKEFIVLLKDGRVVAVRGQGLKHLPAKVNGESGSYGIIIQRGNEEVLVALFKIFEVVGIFHGELRQDRKSA